MTGSGEISYEIRELGGMLDSERKENGWAMEVNVVAWNGGEPKVDIRSWDPTHAKMSRGITLTEEQAYKLSQLLNERYKDRQLATPKRDTMER